MCALLSTVPVMFGKAKTKLQHLIQVTVNQGGNFLHGQPRMLTRDLFAAANLPV